MSEGTTLISSLSSELYGPSGRLINRRPVNKCGVIGSWMLSIEIYESGREFTIISASAVAVCSSSSVSLPLPIVLRKQRFTDLIIRSKMPPHHGALSMLNVHGIHDYDCATPGCLTIPCNIFEGALKVYSSTLSHIFTSGPVPRAGGEGCGYSACKWEVLII